MSKATLTFDLDNPDDAMDHRLAISGKAWALAMWDIDQKLRGWLKHGHEFKTPDEALQAARDFLHEALSDDDLSLDMIQ